MMAATFDESGAGLAIATRARILEWPYVVQGRWPYDVSVDGQRFMALKDVESAGDGQQRIVVVQNFFTELERLVPSN